jgi:hypothetical protein
MLDMKQVDPQIEAMADYMAARAGLLATVLNFSQSPISRDQRAEIVKAIGVQVRELHHPAHVDTRQPLRPQVQSLVAELMARMSAQHIERVDYIVPANHPAVAHMLGVVLGNDLAVIWFRRESDDHPAVFKLGGIE